MDKQLESRSIPATWINALNQDFEFKAIDSSHINISSYSTDAFDESISLMISKVGNQFMISDQGYTLWNLESGGITLCEKCSNEDAIKSLTGSANVSLSNDGNISKLGPIDQVPQLVYDLTHTILRISRLI